MRNLTITFLFFLLSITFCCSQPTPNQTLNLSFEKTNEKGIITGCYFSWNKDDYFSYKDDSVKKDGNNSIRLQKEISSTKPGFGVITFSLPANFKGAEIALRGFIKTENVQDGYAGLWLRSDMGAQTLGFDNMNGKGVTATTDWKQYSITVSMNEEVTSIAFGGLLTGKGKSWFDKLELLIDDKPVESVAWIKPAAAPLKKELTASGVAVDSVLTRQQTENLYVLGKVWGFLKYHHPETAKGIYNFDSCLFSIIPSILKAESNKERDDLLFRWINTLGDEDKYPVVPPADSANVHTKPGLYWIKDKTIFSEELSRKLNNVYQHRNSGANYYVKLAPGVGNPVFDKEAIYKDVPAGDDGFRMLALFRYWNMIEYFFPNKHLLKEKWDDILKDFVPAFASNRSELNYRLTCLRLINRVHDTHANIYNDPLLQNYFGNKTPAVDFKKLDGKIIVTGFLHDSLAAFETLQPGDEILTVNGKKMEELRKNAELYLCASNESVADRNFIDRYLFRSNDDSLLVTYKRKGKSKEAVLHLYTQGKFPYRNGDNWRMPMYKLLSPDIGYISLGKIEADSLATIFKTFSNTKGIVIDIRNYPSQFMPFAMAAYIKPSSTPFVKFTNGDLKNPGQFSFTMPIKNGPAKMDNEKNYKGRIVILVNEQSQSQAEYTTMALRTAPYSVVMGSQTAGADGNISYVPFPGGFSSPFSGIGVFYPDGKETQGIGIIPDIIIMPTQKGITAGKDEVIEKAIEFIRKIKPF
jgi:C-terminal processing protease CtpA/Prc